MQSMPLIEAPVLPLLDVSVLRQALGPDAGRFKVEALASCDSTNTRLLARAPACAADGSISVLVADHQTQGRGRRGRAWIATPRESLTFSLLWHAPVPLGRLAGLSLGLGLALARALERFDAQHLQLKWPNDLLYCPKGRNAKLAGILVELAGSTEKPIVVAGIGLNLSRPADNGFSPACSQDQKENCRPQDPQDQGDDWAGLSACCVEVPDRALLLAALLQETRLILDSFADAGFAALRDAWQRRHVAQDRPVCLLDAGKIVAQGICRGVDADGALLLEEAAGIRRHLAGDVSLRLAGGALSSPPESSILLGSS
jgi:BirA family biotin operon repressor/biotin-[acetyl-CoA-carboxylase] ligase